MKTECRGWLHLDPHWWRYIGWIHWDRICLRCGKTETFNIMKEGWVTSTFADFKDAFEREEFLKKVEREAKEKPRPTYLEGLKWLMERRK